MKKLLALSVAIVAGIVGFSILYFLGVHDIGDLVGFVFGDALVGIILYFLLEQKKEHVLPPETQVHAIDPESQEAKKLSEAEERLRKQYGKFFVFIDSVKSVPSDRYFSILMANVDLLLTDMFAFASSPIDKSWERFTDRDMLRAIAEAHFISKLITKEK
jgi:hypothetical protein